MSTSIRLICGYLLICCAVAVYDKRAALLMTHYSSLAYDPEQVETGIGENIRQLFLKNKKWTMDSQTNGFCFLGYDQILNAIVVVFRGTQSSSWKNWNTNFQVKLVPYEDPAFPDGCKVHQGYYHTYRQSFSKISNDVTHLMNRHKTKKVYVTGHSLGGALALLFALDLHNQIHLKRIPLQIFLYTFGQPRVCNIQMAKQVDKVLKNYYRIVHSNDAIPGIPVLAGPAKYYYHAGMQYWFTHDMKHFQVRTSEHQEGAGSKKFLHKLLFPSDHDIRWMSNNMPLKHEQVDKIVTRSPTKTALMGFLKMDVVDRAQAQQTNEQKSAGGPMIPSMDILKFAGVTPQMFAKCLQLETDGQSYKEQDVFGGQHNKDEDKDNT